MGVTAVSTQLRTTDLDASIAFYVEKLGFELAFRYQDFYAGIKAGPDAFHLKLVDRRDPSIDAVAQGGDLHLYFAVDDVEARAAALTRNGVTIHKPLADTPWGTRDFYVLDDQGHTLCFSQALS
jgi:catechol 2,3-dioxygenase-like lactoylglutathione lyase family enzyme